MDAETFGAIDSLRSEVKARFDTLTARIDAFEAHTKEQFDTLTARIDASAAHTRRHFDIVAESTHDDVRIIAEGPVALNAKVDAMRR